MKRTIINTVLTIVVLSLAVLQAPLFYYYTFGLFSVFVALPYMFAGGLLTLILFIRLNNDKSKTTFQSFGAIAGLVLGIGTLFLEGKVEKIDWYLRRDSRSEIVALVKEGKISPNVSHNDIVSTLDDWDLPPISNGGNEIVIFYGKDSEVTVQFYIDRGFLDHYSAFVYTDDDEQIKELEERILNQKEGQGNKKLDENWYRVSY